nr:DNA/RNA non-specific endonuclease [Tumebacillus amylolyticus]
MQKTVGNRSVARYLAAAQRKQQVVQGKFEFGGKSYDKGTLEDDDVADPEGSEGKITKYQSDSNLPTFYGVLKSIFQDNLNPNAFPTSKDLGENIDRPHSVSATLNKQSQPDARQGNPVVTAIGRLGNEELLLRDGFDKARATAYDGGHLVGYQVLGGSNADRAWNVAPQDRENNQGAYNYTIEQMLRKAKKGTVISYTVELGYKSLNFSVDQNQLLEHKVIFKLDDTKPWEIQLPSRIPYKWEASAQITNQGGSFGAPAVDNSNGDDDMSRTYKQLTNNLDNDKLVHDDSQYTARYMLKFGDKDAQDMKHDDAISDISKVRSVNYRMMQVQPEERDLKGKPIDWKGPEKTNYGEVKLNETTLQEILDLEKELNQLLQDVKGDEEQFQNDDAYMKELNELPDDSVSTEQAYGMGVNFLEIMPEANELQFLTTEALRFQLMQSDDNAMRDEIELELKKAQDPLDDKTPQKQLLLRKVITKTHIRRLQMVKANRAQRKDLHGKVKLKRKAFQGLIHNVIALNTLKGKKYTISSAEKRKISGLFDLPRGERSPSKILKKYRVKFK